jgi:hypothetical protein
MTNREAVVFSSFVEALIRSYDPDNLLLKNTHQLYKEKLVETLESLSKEIHYATKKKELQQADSIRFRKWSDSICPLLAGLEILLEEEGELQAPDINHPCICGEDAAFCYEYQNEYRLVIRMNKGKKTIVHLDYVFSQSQTWPTKETVRFSEFDCEVKKNVVSLDYFPGKTPDQVLGAIKQFIAAFCEETVEDFVELPATRDESPLRH